jgi:hypothetical protein
MRLSKIMPLFFLASVFGLLLASVVQAAEDPADVSAEIVITDFKQCSSTGTFYRARACPCAITDITIGGEISDTSAEAFVTMSQSGSRDNCVGTLHVCIDATGTPSRTDCVSDTNIDSKQTYAATEAEVVHFTGGTAFTGLSASTQYYSAAYFVPSGSGRDNRITQDSATSDIFPTTPTPPGAGGLEDTNARFIGTGGNDSNNGQSHAQRWLTVGKANSEVLPEGTDIYFLDDGNYDDDTTLVLSHNGDGASDSVIIDTYCLDAGTTPINYDSADVDCGERAIISGINAIGATRNQSGTGLAGLLSEPDYTYNKIKITDFVGGAIIPWHPGYYMLVRSSRSTNDPDDIAVRHGWYDENTFDTQTEVRGAVIYVNWNEIEPTKDDYGSAADSTYGIGYLQAEVAKLETLNKRFWIRMDDACFNSQYNPWKCFPAYAVQEGLIGGFERTTAVRMWDGGARDRWKKLLAKIQEAVGNDPYFEGISVNKETSVGSCRLPADIISGARSRIPGVVYCADGDNARSFSTRASGIANIAVAASETFKNSSSVVAVNFLGAVTNSVPIFDTSIPAGVGIGAPDGSPRCTPHTAAGGEAGDCISPGADYATQENQQYAPYRLMAQPPAEHLFQNTTNLKVPIHYSVEGSILGVQNSVKEFSGTSPALLNKWFTEVVKPSHLSITRTKETYDNSQAQWLWDNTKTPTYGVVDYYTLQDLILTYPRSGWNAIGLACPESHGGLCWTDED